MLKLKTLVALASSILMSACANRYDYGDLIGGYKVVAMNPVEIYVERPDGVLIAGPSLRGVALHDGKIFTVSEVERKPGHATSEYGIIFSARKTERMGMSYVEFSNELKVVGSEYPNFNNPSKFFTKKYD